MKREFDATIAIPPAEQVEFSLAAIERADDEHDPSALLIDDDISFDALHADPRWPRRVAKVRAPREGRGAA
ncbi:MAG: hypothetical protein ABI330_22140 [Caldimonas sp.]